MPEHEIGRSGAAFFPQTGVEHEGRGRALQPGRYDFLPPALSFAGLLLDSGVELSALGACWPFRRSALRPPLPVPVDVVVDLLDDFGFVVVLDELPRDVVGFVVFERFVPDMRVPLLEFAGFVGCVGFVTWVFVACDFPFGEPCSDPDAPFLT